MERDHSVASVVGEVTRTLLLAQVFWGARGSLRVCDLTEILAVAEPRVRRVLYVLYRCRWIWYDSERGIVGLTESGFAALARRAGGTASFLGPE